jgi:phosphate-selective porin OprO and OprP
MSSRYITLRLTALLFLFALFAAAPRVAFTQLLVPPQNATAQASDTVPGPISENYAWDTDVVANNGPATGRPGAEETHSKQPRVEDAASLAKRIEALEQTVRQLKSAASAEALPAPKKDSKDIVAEAAAGGCTPKKIDTIIKPTFTPLGRIGLDGVTYDDGDATKEFFNTDRDNEFGFRSFRIGGKGNIYENLIYNVEFEVRGTNSSIAYKDIYMEQQSLPYIGHLRVGHFKEPVGLEEFGSDLYLTFMERAPATNAFAPSRNFGVMLWDTTDECQDLSWFTGLFRADSPDSPTNTGEWRSDNNDWSFDTRVAWLPYYDEPSNGRYLAHLGGSYSFRHIGGLTTGATYNQNTAYSTLNGLAEFSTRSWVGSQAPIGFGAEADSDEWNQLSPELLLIWGSASVQAEYFQLLMNSGERYNGGYAFFTYFLTGENRAYRKDLKTIDRTQPFEPFFWVDTAGGHCCGWGAWELAMGYSWVNLDDGHDIVTTTPANATNRRRGFDNAFVIGVNWYQNAWSHMYFDYSREIIDFVDAGVPTSNANIFGIRWQVDW